MATTITDRIGGILSSVAVKAPCQAATTANITLYGLQTIDGYTTVEGDRVLVKAQTSSPDNGIYIAHEADWVRDVDWVGNRDAVPGTQVRVQEGSTNANTVWVAVAASIPIIVGTTAVTFMNYASFVGLISSVTLAFAVGADDIFSVTDNTVAGVETITLDLKTQAANTVFAGPGSGPDAKPTFRDLNATDLASGGGGGSPPVTSVFGRTGAVVKAGGDYAVADITGAAPLNNPTFTGTPAAPTPSTGDNTTKIATTAFVKAQGYLAGDPGYQGLYSNTIVKTAGSVYPTSDPEWTPGFEPSIGGTGTLVAVAGTWRKEGVIADDGSGNVQALAHRVA